MIAVLSMVVVLMVVVLMGVVDGGGAGVSDHQVKFAEIIQRSISWKKLHRMFLQQPNH